MFDKYKIRSNDLVNLVAFIISVYNESHKKHKILIIYANMDNIINVFLITNDVKTIHVIKLRSLQTTFSLGTRCKRAPAGLVIPQVFRLEKEQH